MIGKRFGSYCILEKLGQGGMGEVYKAEDTRLKRLVAIKVIRHDKTALDQGKIRFLQEARAASALNHPNIVQIYELDSQDGEDFIVMEYVPGQTLAQLLRTKRLSIDTALDYSNQIASALAAAHAASIVHRDMKPGNVIVSDAGAVKILDFGLAKLEQIAVGDSTLTAGPETATGAVLGTASYMSPEQAEGKAVDARSDIFSTGALLYEMLTGKRAFDGDSTISVLSRVLRDAPPSIRELRPDVPHAVARIVGRCLEKNPALRYPSGRELARELIECRRPASPVAFTRRALVPAATVLLVAITLGGWFYYRNARAHWKRDQALPKIRKLIAKSDYAGAFDVTRTALTYAPDDPQLKQHWSEVSIPLTLTTTPPGAKVSYRRYGDAKAPWLLLGQTPFKNTDTPLDYMQLRLERQGLDTAEFAAYSLLLQEQNIPLPRAGVTPVGMVFVPARAPWTGPSNVMPLPDYFLDKFEVTNGQFLKFINAGAYRQPKYWRFPFRKDGRDMPFEQAVALLHDATGRLGPAGWELGAFPKDQADFPVSGVSWFEAAAYCDYAGKALPTIHHWRKAAGFGFGLFSDILLFSNFAGGGPARAGAYTGITSSGAYDMAGNVKEWCQNPVGERRAILGGGWNEPSYMFQDEDAQEPFTRAATYGFRCAAYQGQIPPAALAPMQRPARDYSVEKPVPDETFEIFRRLYAYDKTPLDVKTESVNDSNEYWRKEKVSYRAAYGEERIPAYLYLPRNAKPPYQTVLWAPGGYALGLRSSENAVWTEFFTFLLQTGRAVLYPVYKGTFERRPEKEAGGPNAFRERTIQFAKDVSRSVDFLESRPDIQSGKLAYYGISYGAVFGSFFLALEPRLKTGILVGGGLFDSRVTPEADPLNFASRVRAPVLMLNGRYDFSYPLATLQQPLFRLLGTPEADKRHILFESGHMPPLQDLMREVLNWLDHYLGPVSTNQ